MINFNELKKHITFENGMYLSFFMFFSSVFAMSEHRAYFEIIFYVFFGIYFLKNIKITKYFYWSSAVVIYSFFSIFWTRHLPSAKLDTRILLQLAICGNLLIAFIDSETRLNNVFKIIAFSGIVLLVKLLVNIPISTWLDGRLGLHYVGVNPNTIGLYLSVSIIFSFYLFTKTKGKEKYLLVLLTVIYAIVTLLSGSRKALVLIGITFLMFTIVHFINIKNKKRALIWIILLAFFSYLIVMKVPLFYNIIGNRMETMIGGFLGIGNVDESFTIRMFMIKVGKELFALKPVFGHGIGSYGWLSGFNTYAHNNFIELLVGIGLVGTLIFYSLHIYLVKELFSNRHKQYLLPILICVLSLLFLDYGLVSYKDFAFQMILAISFAAVTITKEQENTTL